jgi:hypothetical protein
MRGFDRATPREAAQKFFWFFFFKKRTSCLLRYARNDGVVPWP